MFGSSLLRLRPLAAAGLLAWALGPAMVLAQSPSEPPAPPPAPEPVQAAPAAPTPPTPAKKPAACVCPQDGGTLEHALSVAQEIFTGEAVSEQLVGLELRRFTILVSSSWRDDLPTIQAETAAGPCGAKLELGKSYLFYGTWKADHSAVLIGACIRYVDQDEAAGDLARLGAAPHQHPITLERRQAVLEGAEQAKKARGCSGKVPDAPSFFLPVSRTVKFARQRLIDENRIEVGGFHGTWTPRPGKEGIFVELVVENHSACALHLKLEASAGGQPVHLSRSEEFIPAGPPFRVRFVVSPPAGSVGPIEFKPSWELVAGGG